MDSTYRFRFLIYLAAFMLIMSVCFVYAEPIPSASGSPLLFQTTPQSSAFLAPISAQPSFDPAALRASTVPTVSPVTLQQIEDAARTRHHLFHRARPTAPRLQPVNAPSESSVHGLRIQQPATSAR
jgi:hypothetical protein